MKKLVLTIWLLVYALGTGGLTLHQHVCMGKLAGVSLASNKAGACPRCGMAETEKAGCCDESSTSFKIKDDHGPRLLVFLFQPSPSPSPVFFVPEVQHLLVQSSTVALQDLPPGDPLRRLAQLRVFRI